MNSMNDKKLAKFLLGESTSNEREEVLNWINASEENRRLFDEFEKTWIETGKLSPRPIDVDIDAAWNKISKQTVNNESHHTSIMRWAVAAAVILLIGITGILKTLTAPKSSEVFANKTAESQLDSLPDGSTILLCSNSTITYNFDKKKNTRNVKLEGDAFFEVKRDESQKFIVNAGIGGVEVLGTSFNVKTIDNKDLQIDVRTGTVRLFYPMESGDTLFLIINKGESGLISAQLDSIIILEQPIEAFFDINQSLSFNNVPLDSVFMILSECYETPIATYNEQIGNLTLTSYFKNESIESIIEVIANTFDLTYTQKNDSIIFNNKKEEN